MAIWLEADSNVKLGLASQSASRRTFRRSFECHLLQGDHIHDPEGSSS